MKLLIYCALILHFLASTAMLGVVNLCQKVRPSVNLNGLVNCPLVCNPKFINFDSNDELLALCKEREDASTFLPCKTNTDCRYYHISATCKKIPCFCEDQGPFGNQTIYVLDPKASVPHLDVCTVFQKELDPEVPSTLPPFPWKTLLVVFGIVASCAACLIIVRWLSPYIRRMQAKNTTRNRQNRRQNNDNTTLFTGIPLPERTYIRPCGQYPNRRTFELSASTSNSDCNADKPPPYELAIQGPPAYEEVEEEPLNPDTTSVFLPNSHPVSVATL